MSVRVRVGRPLAATLAGLALAGLTLAGCDHAHDTPQPAPPSLTPTGPGGGPVGENPPQTFAPAAASFPTTEVGFALGLSACRTGVSTLCPALLRTADAGRHWAALSPPPLLVLTDPLRHPALRFADALDGFAADGQPGGTLDATHDGGRTWTPAHLPGSAADDRITAIGSDDGHVVVVGGDADGQHLWLAGPVRSVFTESPVTLPAATAITGAVSLALADGSGWLTAGPDPETGRPTYLRTVDDTVWTAVPSPCAAGDTAAVAASDGRDVTMLCQSPAAGVTAVRRTYASDDDGRTFTPRGTTGGDGYLAGLADAAPTVVEVATSATSDDLLRSADGGRTFALTYSSQAGGTGQGLFDLAFTDAGHGTAVLGSTGSYALEIAAGVQDAPTTRLLLTADGGRHWTQAFFQP